MALDKDDVAKIAHLARLQLPEASIPEVTERLTSILGMIEQLQSVDTTNVTPMAHPNDATQRLRSDSVSETNHREEYQAIAPATADGLYLVPKVIE